MENIKRELFEETKNMIENGLKEKEIIDDLKTKYIGRGLTPIATQEFVHQMYLEIDGKLLTDKVVVRANKIKSEVMQALNQGKVATAAELLDRYHEKKQEVVFDEWTIDTPVAAKATRTFGIGHDKFDSFSPFETESICMIAGLTGSGKTTVAINLIKAFITNNNCDVLFLESDSETSPDDIKRLCHKIGLTKIQLATFPRFDDMKKGFLNILDKYKTLKGKYPDIVFIDTFEKMNASSENYALKMNTEALSYLCQETKCLFITLSQFSSAQYKANKKQLEYYTMEIQQGGMDVINNVNTWISMKRHVDLYDEGPIHFNNFFFGKVRGVESSVHLYNRLLKVPFCMDDFNLNFQNMDIKDVMQ